MLTVIIKAVQLLILLLKEEMNGDVAEKFGPSFDRPKFF